MVHAGGERQVAVGEADPAGQQHVALAKVDAGGADMPAEPCGLGDGDVAAVRHGIFLDHDGVGALGDHAAGEDPHRLACANRLVERPAGRDLANHRKTRPGEGRIRRAHRIAVHRRHRLRRLGTQCRDIARQHPVIGRIQRDHFFRQRLSSCKDGGKRISNRHQRHDRTPKTNPRCRAPPALPPHSPAR